ncbi:MAG: hypothetical protein ABSG68_10765 [Thermoguttaceae bacterium]|jgi:hypothetical protein
MRAFVLGLLLLLPASGCTQFQMLRVVDESGQPVDGVPVERLTGSVRPSAAPLVLHDELSPAERKTTNSSGAIKFDEAGKQFMVNGGCKNAAYGHAYVKASWTGVEVVYPDQYRSIHVNPKNGVLEVPLPTRLPGSQAEHPRDQRGDDPWKDLEKESEKEK